MKTRHWIVPLSAAALALTLGGCGAVNQLTEADAGRVTALDGKIGQAEEMDARDCAPEELARARALVEHADHEAREWHPAGRVAEEFQAAQVVVDDLLAKTQKCYDAKRQAAREGADADRDGVPDYKDRCPGTPTGAPVDAVGCPRDSDGDGVADYLDKCPNTPGGTPVDAAGCPRDSDGDGVADNLDKCPNTPRGAPVDGAGCLRDSDRDGLTDWDETQKYGTDPRNADTDGDGLKDGDEVKRHGTSAKNPDTDGDGLKDGLEVNKHGTKPTVADTDGGSVNDGLEVLVGGTNPLDPADDVKEVKCVELQIQYATDDAGVGAEYYAEVERVAAYLKEFPQLHVQVQGHTDNVGDPRYNKDLSLRRAQSVVDLLTGRYGIAASRLSAKGFGDTEPIASNDTERGRAKNRRIYALLECK